MRCESCERELVEADFERLRRSAHAELDGSVRGAWARSPQVLHDYIAALEEKLAVSVRPEGEQT